MNQITKPRNEEYMLLYHFYKTNTSLILKEELEGRVEKRKHSPVFHPPEVFSLQWEVK